MHKCLRVNSIAQQCLLNALYAIRAGQFKEKNHGLCVDVEGMPFLTASQHDSLNVVQYKNEFLALHVHVHIYPILIYSLA